MPGVDAATRLRQILLMLPWLAGRGQTPVAELSAKFGLQPDEVVALLERAACCGLPPYTPDRLVDIIVADGMVEVCPGPHLSRPLRLSAAEGFAVAATARALLSIPGADESGPLATAAEKLEAALGERSRLAVNLDSPSLLARALAAAEKRETIEVEYHSAAHDETTVREIDPHLVYAREGHWYLDAYCHMARGVRHFRLDRVRAIRPTGRNCSGERTAASDPEAPVPGPDSTTVRLDVPASACWIADTYPVYSVEVGGEGRLEISLPVSGRAWLERLMLRVGPGGRVLSPAELVGAPAKAAHRILALYR